MKKLLIIDRYQFGYTTDTLKYCEYLNNKYKIRYLSFDFGWEKIYVPNINVIYVPRFGNKAMRAILFILYSIYNIIAFNGFTFILYFPQCSILKKLLFWKKMHLDIRTLCVDSDSNIRQQSDLQLQKDLNYFDSSSFITEGIRKKITSTSKKNSFILPLGSDIISSNNKTFEELNLLYVGTLTNRNIIETVKGFISFIESSKSEIKIHYDIIGDGENGEREDIQKFIDSKQMNKYITLHGKLPYHSLKPFFNINNIGISFIPITDYYEHQPPTKTYEYVLSGLYCMATKTAANKEIINKDNGILHNDTAEDFYKALDYIYQNRHNLNSQIIRHTLLEYQWNHIIEQKLLPILNLYESTSNN